jgi:hypothetical protein
MGLRRQIVRGSKNQFPDLLAAKADTSSIRWPIAKTPNNPQGLFSSLRAGAEAFNIHTTDILKLCPLPTALRHDRRSS